MARFNTYSQAAALIPFRLNFFICEMGVEPHLQSRGDEKNGIVHESWSPGAMFEAWICHLIEVPNCKQGALQLV